MTATHCPYCALQCAMDVTPAPGAVPAAVAPLPFPTSGGGLCQKGWTAAEVLRPGARLTTPMRRPRRGAPLEAVGWDDALDHVADRLRGLVETDGPDAVALLGGGGLTNEKAYLLGKFARVALGTSQVDYNGRFCMSSAAAAGTRAFGVDRGMPFPVTDLDHADAVLLAGSNPAETMPPFVAHLRGARCIVVDPRRSPTAEAAVAGGGIHLAPAPGTDLELALAMLHVAVADGHLDRAYVDERTTGLDAAWRAAASWWPERAERVTGVAAADLRSAVAVLAEAGNAYVLTGRGTEQHARGTAAATAWIQVALALGLPGRPGSGYGCLTGQGNGQGGREHGQKADQLPGYRRIDDAADRAHVAGVWDVDPASLPGPGRSAYELLDALGRPHGPRALLLHGSNPAVSAPRSGHVVDRLAALDLLVVADVVASETVELADVVLPVTQWAEEDGTVTNLEGRVLRRRRAVAPPPGVRSDLEVLAGLARRLGQPAARFPCDARAVYDELRAASAGGAADYVGITWERLDAGEALYWPCPGEHHAGTPRMFTERFAHPDGRARFVAVHADARHGDEAGPPPEAPDEDYPLRATTGRVLAHYQSGAQTRRVPALVEAASEAHVEVHPDVARRCGLTDGARARVISRRGAMTARVRQVPDLRCDTVFLPFHYGGEQAANLLTDPGLDPVSRMPSFKACAVRLEPVPA